MNSGAKEIMRQAGLGKFVDKVEHGFCPTCDKPVVVTDFKDELSKKEYEISGMCQKCQDEVFSKGI